jgi:prolipoprotein diacylglyceryltransferase
MPVKSHFSEFLRIFGVGLALFGGISGAATHSLLTAYSQAKKRPLFYPDFAGGAILWPTPNGRLCGIFHLYL